MDLTENSSSNSAAAKKAAGETRSRFEKSPVLIEELVRGLAITSQAGALISEPFSDHRVDPFWIGL